MIKSQQLNQVFFFVKLLNHTTFLSLLLKLSNIEKSQLCCCYCWSWSWSPREKSCDEVRARARARSDPKLPLVAQ